MYHGTNKTVEYKVTGREAQTVLVKEWSNLKYIFKNYCTRFFITPMAVIKLGVLTRPMSPFTAEFFFILLACLKYMYKYTFAYFSVYKLKCKNHGKCGEKPHDSWHYSIDPPLCCIQAETQRVINNVCHCQQPDSVHVLQAADAGCRQAINCT